MSVKPDTSTKQSTVTATAGAWDLRHPGLIMTGSNGQEVHEFLGMWPLKPDADLVDIENGLSREAPFWGGPGKTFAEATTMLGLIRTARWFVGTSTEFGPTSLLRLAVRQQPGEVLRRLRPQRGRRTSKKVWGTVRRLSERPGRHGARHRAVRRARADQDHGLLRRSSEPQLGPDPKDGRLVPEDAEVPARGLLQRRQPRGQGQLLFQRPDQAVRIRAERRHHRHRPRQPVAVHRRSRTVGRQEEEGSLVLRNSPAPRLASSTPWGRPSPSMSRQLL